MPGRCLVLRPDHDQLAQHVVFHERQEFVVMLVLVMVRVDVDDQNVVEVALVRLLARMREEPRGVELLDGDAAAAIGDQVHDVSRSVIARSEATKQSSACAKSWIASLRSQ